MSLPVVVIQLHKHLLNLIKTFIAGLNLQWTVGKYSISYRAIFVQYPVNVPSVKLTNDSVHEWAIQMIKTESPTVLLFNKNRFRVIHESLVLMRNMQHTTRVLKMLSVTVSLSQYTIIFIVKEGYFCNILPGYSRIFLRRSQQFRIQLDASDWQRHVQAPPIWRYNWLGNMPRRWNESSDWFLSIYCLFRPCVRLLCVILTEKCWSKFSSLRPLFTFITHYETTLC